MQSVIRGRVIELWTDSRGELSFELAVKSRRCTFHIPQGADASPFLRGDLLEVRCKENTESTCTGPFTVMNLAKLGGPKNGEWNPLSDGMRWRRNSNGASRMSNLKKRQDILREIREDLYQKDFLEIETPLVVKGACPDSFIESVDAGKEGAYLATSTEYQIKRLIVGGFEKVFTLTKNFRGGERGRYHSSEFTMLEWGRSYDSLTEIEEDAIRFIRRAFRKLYPEQSKLKVRKSKHTDGPEFVEIDFMEESWERLTVRQAFNRYLGLKDVQDFSLEALLGASRMAGVEIPTHFQEDRSLVLSYLLDQVQPHLGNKTPTFLQEWPAFLTSSARLSTRDPHVAERSELYISGIEIADGFPFLRDPDQQMKFFNRENEARRLEGKPVLTLDSHYVAALAEGIPPGAGMALGMDRLVMVLVGGEALRDVQAFDWEEL